jgi:hypothetical protein
MLMLQIPDRVLPKVLENRLHYVFNFLHEVTWPKSKITDRAGFFLEIPVFRILGPTTRFWTVFESSKWVCNCQKTALTIFLIFGMKLGDHKWRKLTEPDFARKLRFSRIWARRSVSGPKNQFFSNIGMWPLVWNRRTSGLRKKCFRPNLAFWVEIWSQKANFLAKFLKKKIFFQKFFFSNLAILSRKKAKKTMKKISPY